MLAVAKCARHQGHVCPVCTFSRVSPAAKYHCQKRRLSLYLRLNLTISSTSQTYLLVQHQSKATLTRGNIVGKLHNSLCHTQDKKRSKQLTCLKQQYRRRTWSIFIANSMCPDLSWFACEQSQHGEREPLHATSWLKASSILHKQAHRKIFLYKWQGDKRELDIWLWPHKRRRLIIICSFD